MAGVRKPRFRRQESWRLKRVHEAWRRPRGVTSRMRKEKGGWPSRAKVGYGTASKLKGLHPRGLSERLVEKLSDLNGLDPKSHIVRFSARLGERKRLLLREKAREFGLRIANPGREGVSTVEEQGEVEKAQASTPAKMSKSVTESSETEPTSDSEELGS